MKLSVLTENCASAHFKAEHGLSYFIEHENKKILFDFGDSDIFLQNAEKLNINIDEVDKIVLSHGHWDHGNGLKYLKNKTLVCHPEAFKKRTRENENIGLKLSKEELYQKFEVQISQTPYYISEKIIFLGEIPRINNFEAQNTPYIDKFGKPDFVFDDSALAIIQNNEIIVISGCSHSGICNICDYAKKVTGISKIKAVIGGFHLKKDNFQTKETVKYFKKEKISYIYPAHCTQLPALSVFYNEFKISHLKSGMVLEI